MTEEDVAQVITEDQTPEALPDKLACNPEILGLVKNLFLSSLPPGGGLVIDTYATLYHAAKLILRQHKLGNTTQALADAIFAYYFRCCLDMRELSVNDGCMSIFDLATTSKHDNVIGKVLLRAAEAVHEIITAHFAETQGLDFNSSLQMLQDIALVTTSIERYAASNGRRVRNRQFIHWVRNLLEPILTQGDISKLRTNPQLPAIREQIIKRKHVIEL